MKLTDEELKRLRLTVTDNCLPDYSSMLTQLVQSEQAAWEAAENQKENNLSLAWEVKRLKEENAQMKDLHMRTLMHIKEDLYWGDSDNAIDRVVDKFIQPILDRMQKEETES